ncbi:hypothetical protein MHL31_11225 [Lutibacter sp. A80]|uniref:hypothetical protein n=1 Tax=Lutibacter sp. A80 TaxID=2918453 RepID=UPI001F05D1F1|nr:hypothetical protein [Lutibacter sp. A80]UMB59649.1 hypothetical protein MHL31_11225 [Lutibacter sp. A80]
MNISKRKVWKVLIIALIVSTSAFAQQRGGQRGGERGGQRGGQQTQQARPAAPTTEQIEEMVSELSNEILLSEDQQSKILVLYKEYFEEIESKSSSGRPDRDEMQALKEDFEDNVKAVLTEDQQKLYTAYLKKNTKKRRS